jgi:hypothetical protein
LKGEWQNGGAMLDYFLSVHLHGVPAGSDVLHN